MTVELENTEKIFKALYNSVPPIGFMSRKKRIMAYIKVTKKLQDMIDNGEADQEEALFVLSMLVRKHKQFQKAGMMTALNLQAIGSKALSDIGFDFANQVRNNIKLHAIDKEEDPDIV